MTKVEKERIEELLTLKTAAMGEKYEVQALIKKYINNGAHYCMNCDGSVRNMFKVLRMWWGKQGNYKLITEIKTKK